MYNHVWRCGLGIFVATVLSASCGSDDAGQRVLLVPDTYATIQEAVDEARTGDVVRVSPGVYSEAVKVSTDGVVIQGADRNGVILDGGNRLANGISVVANGVSVQNLTIHSYTQNGIVFNGIQGATRGGEISSEIVYGANGNWIDGYHVSHITSYNNGLYGIYAFASTNGVIEDSYTSGHPDSGIYVGQCSPCNVLIQRVIADTNAIGYYGTNASGNVFVINSTFSNNRIGIAPNSQKAEKLSPQRETFIVGNKVLNNGNPRAPQVPDGAFGLGIAVGGGTKNEILRNLVIGNDVVGISVMTLGEFAPENNRVEENIVRDNGIDLAYVSGEDGKIRGNCFAKNVFTRSMPPSIERSLSCPGRTSSISATELPPRAAPPAVDYKKIQPPPAQPSLTIAQLAKLVVRPIFSSPDISKVVVPQ